MKKYKYFTVVVILSALLVAFMVYVLQPKTPIETIDYATGDTYMALLDDSYIFMRMNNNGKTVYYRQSLFENTVIKIGEIPDFFTSTKGCVIIGEKLFFSATTQNEQKIKNSLYEIDLINNSLSEVLTDNLCSFELYTFAYNNCVAIAKYYYEGDYIKSCVDLYNPKDNTVRTVLLHKIDNTNLDGSIILRACSNDKEIFVLKDIGSGSGQVYDTNISVYNVEQNFDTNVKTISLGDIYEYIMKSRIYQMNVYGEYIFLSNYSNDSVFGKIEGGKIVPIKQLRHLEIASMSPNILLYLRYTNQLFLFDTSTSELKTASIQADNQYIIIYALAHENNILVVLASKDDPTEEIVYLTSLEDLTFS